MHYDAALVYRMVQRRSYEEGRAPQALVKKALTREEEQAEELDPVDRSGELQVVNDRHKQLIDKYYKPKVPRRKRVAKDLSKEERIEAQM